MQRRDRKIVYGAKNSIIQKAYYPRAYCFHISSRHTPFFFFFFSNTIHRMVCRSSPMRDRRLPSLFLRCLSARSRPTLFSHERLFFIFLSFRHAAHFRETGRLAIGAHFRLGYEIFSCRRFFFVAARRGDYSGAMVPAAQPKCLLAFTASVPPDVHCNECRVRLCEVCVCRNVSSAPQREAQQCAVCPCMYVLI